MAVLLSVVFCLLISTIHVAGLTLCDTDGTLEVVENKADNVFTCTGFSSTAKQVDWYLILGTASNVLAVCKSDLSCTNDHNPPYEARRPAADRSTLTVNATGQLNLIQGRAIACNQSADVARCRLDVIAVPSVPTCNAHVNTGTSSPWTVTVNCNVSGAYSYLNRYNCTLVQTSPSINSMDSANISVTSTSSNGKYKSGTCAVTVSFPSVTGSYTYNMTVSPGRVKKPAIFGSQNSLVIQRPNTAPTNNCPVYVHEFQDVSCTCTATNLGQPAGVARWAGTSSNRLSLSNVSRAQNGQKYTCGVIWNGQSVVSVTYTLQVAYGPSNVSITHPNFPFDTNGQQELTLSCLATDSNPAPTITWPTRPANSIVGQDKTVSFTPNPPGDDKSEFVCQAENTVTGRSKQTSVMLDLNYPPTQDPIITNQTTPSSTDGHLYQGDSVTFTCTVNGGKPLNATTVTFACSGKPPDSVGSSDGTSSVTFTNLNTSNTCTCKTKWKTTHWYDRSEDVNVNVITPPSTPIIHTPNSGYPFIASETRSATLTCQSSDPGHPISTYTWPLSQEGMSGTDDQGRGTLTFDTVTSELNGKKVSCRARNLFTDNRHTVPDGSLPLEVYYKPVISFTSVEGGPNPNQCSFTSSDTCEVIEGQTIHVQCSANSNPPPADFTWQPNSGMNETLLIVSANRSLHNGIYNCTVKTGRGNHGNDQRLPLESLTSATVLVKYTPSVSSFEVNSSPATSLTVNASDVLHFKCQAVGRPPPEIKILHADQSVIAMTPQGPPSLHDTPSRVSSELTTRCQDTGVYSCTATNTVGGTSGPTVSIFVQCQPEAVAGGGIVLPPINFRTQAVHLIFSVRAYPVPWLKQVKFFKQQPDDTNAGQDVSKGIVDIQCVSAESVSSRVTCNLIVDKVMSDNAGFYQAFIGNEFGDLKLQFEIKVGASVLPDPDTDSSSGLGVGGAAGLTLAFMVVVVVVVVVWLWRRQWVLPCAAANGGGKTATVRRAQNQGDLPLEDRSTEHRDVYEIQDNGLPSNSRVVGSSSLPSAYDSLRTNNIGLRSVYTSLPSPYYNTGATGDTGPVYVNAGRTQGTTGEYVNTSSPETNPVVYVNTRNPNSSPNVYVNTGNPNSSPNVYVNTGNRDSSPNLYVNTGNRDSSPNLYVNTGNRDSSPNLYVNTGNLDSSPNVYVNTGKQ